MVPWQGVSRGAAFAYAVVPEVSLAALQEHVLPSPSWEVGANTPTLQVVRWPAAPTPTSLASTGMATSTGAATSARLRTAGITKGLHETVVQAVFWEPTTVVEVGPGSQGRAAPADPVLGCSEPALVLAR